MSLRDIYSLLTEGAQAAGYELSTISGEPTIRSPIRVRINGKRCIARLSTNVVKPAGNTFGNVKFTSRCSELESDADVKAVVLIIAPPEEKPVFYIVPFKDWRMLLREQGQSSRSGKGTAPTLNVTHPPQKHSRLDRYRDDWSPFN